ncbi:MAG: PEGA domain-containing protein, partial [Verrucomicrobiota bacterium]
MRSSSSWRRAIAVSLCVGLAAQGAVPSLAAEGEEPAEPALLLRYAAPDVSEAAAREVLASLPGTVAAQVRVRWVAVPSGEAAAGDVTAAYPLADDAALRSISAKITDASARMEKVELGAAQALLSQAEAEARRFRFTDAVRPFLAEISLQQGILKLWEGDAAGAEALLSRFRALRPDFSPDPALFSPQFLAVWNDVRHRPLPEAELLIQSAPSGARITVDGAFLGTTPARIHPGTSGPVTIRVSYPGYRDAATTGQWLPGDTETIRVTLEGDREARLGELLARSGGKGVAEA